MSIDKCINCPDVKYRQCPAPEVITNGKYCCELETQNNALCSQCEEPLKIGHFAYEPNWKEFWCEECLRELLKDGVK